MAGGRVGIVSSSGKERSTSLPYHFPPASQKAKVELRMRQDSERKQAVAHVRLRGHLPDLAYAACSTAHTSPQRSWNRRRCSAKEIVSLMCWR